MAPPWDVADMLAVMKKDMSSTLHRNADLSRCHSRLAAAVKARDRPTSLSLLADLASNVSSVLLMLPLPAKTDKGEVLVLQHAWLVCISLAARENPDSRLVTHFHIIPFG